MYVNERKYKTYICINYCQVTAIDIKMIAIRSLVPSLPFPNTNLRKRDKRRETATHFFLLSRETGHEAKLYVVYSLFVYTHKSLLSIVLAFRSFKLFLFFEN